MQNSIVNWLTVIVNAGPYQDMHRLNFYHIFLTFPNEFEQYKKDGVIN